MQGMSQPQFLLLPLPATILDCLHATNQVPSGRLHERLQVALVRLAGRPITRAGAFLFLNASSQSWICGAGRSKGHGFFPHQRGAATLSRRVFRASTQRRAYSGR